MDFGEVLTKAWRIVWKFKVLWFFGILAGCGTSRGVNFNGGGSGFSTDFAPGSVPTLPSGLEDNLLKFMNFIETPAAIIGLIIFSLVVISVVTFFTIMGKVALIKGAQAADAVQPHTPMESS